MTSFAFPHGICCVAPSDWAGSLAESALRNSVDPDVGVPVLIVTDRGEHPDHALKSESAWIQHLNAALTGIFHDGWNPVELDAETWVKHCWLMDRSLEKLAEILPGWAWDAKAVAKGHAAWYRQIGAVSAMGDRVAA